LDLASCLAKIWIESRKTYKPEAVGHHLADARRFFNWLADSRYIDRSPFPRGLMPRVPERRPDRLSEADVKKLLRTPEPYRFTIRLGLATGLRWGELAKTQAKDVENGSVVVLAGKTGKVRRIPLPPDLLGEIRRRVGRLVPFSQTSKGSFTRVVRKLSELSGFHPHQMRHTCACRWLEQGMSLPAVQELLGHAAVTTMQRYARLSDDAVRRELEHIWAQTGSLTGSPRSKHVIRKRGKFLDSVSLGR
jgi:integrase